MTNDIAAIVAMAERVFGDKEKATRWLHKETYALNGRTPMDVMSDEDGFQVVEELLGALDYGIYI